MNTHIRLAFALALAGMIGSASAAGEPGREVYERHCRTCHGGTTPPDSPLGPSLVGIIGTKAGTQASGLHSRALTESGIVWDRESLRRFLSDPRRERSTARSCRCASLIPRRSNVCSTIWNRFAERPKFDRMPTGP
jgi:cytochrome c